MNIWQFNDKIMRWLVAWNIPNVIIGMLLSRSNDRVIRGIASQHIGWGIINLGIALIGRMVTYRRRTSLADPYSAEVMSRETFNLRRFLLLNTGLDLLYMLGGWRLAAHQGRDKPQVRGVGFGIMFQGLLLFAWDLWLVHLTESIKTGENKPLSH